MHNFVFSLRFKPGDKVNKIGRKNPYIIETIKLELVKCDDEPEGYMLFGFYDIRSLNNKKLAKNVMGSQLSICE